MRYWAQPILDECIGLNGFAEYLRSERGFGESTIRNYRRHLSEFAEYLSRTGISSFSQLSPAVLAAFCAVQAEVQRLIDAEFSLKTIGDYVGHRSPESTSSVTK
jgi:site-specific recombinase XerC